MAKLDLEGTRRRLEEELVKREPNQLLVRQLRTRLDRLTADVDLPPGTRGSRVRNPWPSDGRAGSTVAQETPWSRGRVVNFGTPSQRDS